METTNNTITGIGNFDFGYDLNIVKLTLDEIPIYRLFASFLLETRNSDDFHQAVENRLIKNLGLNRGQAWKSFREKITPNKYTLSSKEMYRIIGIKGLIKIMRGKRLSKSEIMKINFCYHLAQIGHKPDKEKLNIINQINKG